MMQEKQPQYLMLRHQRNAPIPIICKLLHKIQVSKGFLFPFRERLNLPLMVSFAVFCNYSNLYYNKFSFISVSKSVYMELVS